VNSTEESYEYSRKTIELIMANWRNYIFENDYSAAAQIMLAANYGGRAINITQTTAAHAMSYKITSLYKLPHGHAVAICLPEIWQYMTNNMGKTIDQRGRAYLERIFMDIANAMGYDIVSGAIAQFRQMLHDMELSNPKAINAEEEIQLLVNSVNPIRLKNNPILLGSRESDFLFRLIVHV
jgi:alcohol dehydrogenase class IV